MSAFSPHDDAEFKEISSLADLKLIAYKRGSRKGFITRTERYFASIQSQPLQSTNVPELERKLQELLRHSQFFDALQTRYEFIAEASDMDIGSEIKQADRPVEHTTTWFLPSVLVSRAANSRKSL